MFGIISAIKFIYWVQYINRTELAAWMLAFTSNEAFWLVHFLINRDTSFWYLKECIRCVPILYCRFTYTPNKNTLLYANLKKKTLTLKFFLIRHVQASLFFFFFCFFFLFSRPFDNLYHRMSQCLFFLR